MDTKTLIKAEIRGIEVTIMQISLGYYITNWYRVKADLDKLRKDDHARRKKGNEDKYVPYLNTLTSFEIATQQFREICRAAQNKQIRFE